MSNTVPSLLQDELDRRTWAQADLARVLGWPVQAVSEVIKGKRQINAAMALDLAKITPTPAESWLIVQAAQDLDKERRDPKAETRLERIGRRAELEDTVPMREMVRRGVVDDTDEDVQADQIRRLLEIENLGDDPPYLSHVSAKRTMVGSKLTRAQNAWVALGRQRAREIEAAEYDVKRFKDFAEGLPRQIHHPEDFNDLPGHFAEVGVRLVHIPAFPGGRIDGVSLARDSAPIIVLSGRGTRTDRFLFAVLHGCAHGVLGHWQRGMVQVHEGGLVGDKKTEDAVNRLAQSWILPNGLRPTAGFTVAGIELLASQNGVSPAVMIGQLQHMGIIPWASQVSRDLPTVEEAIMTWS